MIKYPGKTEAEDQYGKVVDGQVIMLDRTNPEHEAEIQAEIARLENREARKRAMLGWAALGQWELMRLMDPEIFDEMIRGAH